MAQKALYDQLETYNSKIPNDFRDNWGSILTFLDGKDTQKLIKRGDNYIQSLPQPLQIKNAQTTKNIQKRKVLKSYQPNHTQSQVTDRYKKSSMMGVTNLISNTQRGDHKDSMMCAETNFTSALQAATNLDLQSGTFDCNMKKSPSQYIHRVMLQKQKQVSQRFKSNAKLSNIHNFQFGVQTPLMRSGAQLPMSRNDIIQVSESNSVVCRKALSPMTTTSKSSLKYKPGKLLPDEELFGQDGGKYKYKQAEDKLIFKNYRSVVQFNKPNLRKSKFQQSFQNNNYNKSEDFSNVQPKVNTSRKDQMTAFGFPTIHIQNEKHNEILKNKAGIPHENTKNATGEPLVHTKYIENELLISKDNPIQNSIKQYIYDLKSTTKKMASPDDQDKREKIRPNDLNRITNTLKKATQQNIILAPRGQSKEIQKLQSAIEMMNVKEEENWRIQALMSAPDDDINLGVKKLYGDEIMKMGPKHYILNGLQQKWIEQHTQLTEHQAQCNLKGRNNRLLGKELQEVQVLSAKAIQQKQLTLAKDLFLTWDGDGEGSLSPQELMKAFIGIGLCQDHHFARGIMASIKPKDTENFDGDIELKDFLKIFKNDEISDHVVEIINKEVIFKKEQAILKQYNKQQDEQYCYLNHDTFETFTQSTRQLNLQIQPQKGDLTLNLPQVQRIESIIISPSSATKRNHSSNLFLDTNDERRFTIEQEEKQVKINLYDDINIHESSRPNLSPFKNTRDFRVKHNDSTSIFSAQQDIKKLLKEARKKPTFGEQISVISDWWKHMIDIYIKEINHDEPNPQNHKQRHLINDVPLNTIYNFLMSQKLAKDRQEATKLVQNQIGLKQLQNEGNMCYEEFKKLFCKGMFKKALIGLIEKLQKEVTEFSGPKMQRSEGLPKDLFGDNPMQQKVGLGLKQIIMEKALEIEKDSHENFSKEMPLTLRIEKFQRQKLLEGVKPTKDPVQQENFRFLQSLKFIQRFEDEVEEINTVLRNRSYEEFKKDPIGKKYIQHLEDEKNMHRIDPYVEKIQFIKDDLKVPKTWFQSPEDTMDQDELQDKIRAINVKRKKKILENVHKMPPVYAKKNEQERLQDQCDNLARMQKLMNKPKGW